MPTLTVPATFVIWLACAAVSLIGARLYFLEEGKKGVATVLLVSATAILMALLEALL